jgi:hypothetical protein
MPNPGTIFLKAMLVFVVAVLLFQYGRELDTVKVTVIADGAITTRVLSADDPTYQGEIERARKKALPVYGLSILAGFVGFAMIGKGVRVRRKARFA